MERKNIDDISINFTDSILFALKKMDEQNTKLLILLDNSKFYGLISIGDIQRAIIKNISLENSVDSIKRTDITFAKTSDNIDFIKNKMLVERDEFMPIINEKGEIHDVIFWNDLFEKRKQEQKLINIPIIIMAGGKGTRMRPLTNVIPKPLIPIGDKTIAEHIIEKFCDHGASDFYFSVNYKADLIQYYFDSIENKKYNINYFQEDYPLGTAGSLSLLKNKFDTPVFVTNCDVIIDQNYNEILDFHIQNENDITMICSLKHIYLPYGTVETGESGELISMKEKPELTFMINTGMYILNSEILNEINENEFLHITTLISNLKEKGKKVSVFPISEKQYYDIGEWEYYLKTLTQLG